MNPEEIQDPVANALGAVPGLRKRCVALAMLDAILCPDWEYRGHSFNRFWDKEQRRTLASFRDGYGNDFFLLFFGKDKAVLKGFDHEAFQGNSVPGALEGLPTDLEDFRTEPAFDVGETFCLWNIGSGWQRSPAISSEIIAQDGSKAILALLYGTPVDYVAYAKDAFDLEISEAVVARFFAWERLTPELANELVPGTDVTSIDNLDEIGYPGT